MLLVILLIAIADFLIGTFILVVLIHKIEIEASWAIVVRVCVHLHVCVCIIFVRFVCNNLK